MGQAPSPEDSGGPEAPTPPAPSGGRDASTGWEASSILDSCADSFGYGEDSGASSGHDGALQGDGGSEPDVALPDEAGLETGARDSTADDRWEPDAAPPIDCSADAGGATGASGAPHFLACTGLYSDFAAGSISPSAVAYDPGLHLWTDGATKRRFIYLPPGTQIDTSDMDEWTFPVSTKGNRKSSR